MRELAGLHRRATCDRVLIKRDGQPWVNPQKAWERCKKRAKVDPSTRFHDLRHTAIMMMLLENVPSPVAGEVVEHRSEKSLKRYTHVTERAKHEAVRTLDWDKAVAKSVVQLDEARAVGDVSADE